MKLRPILLGCGALVIVVPILGIMTFRYLVELGRQDRLEHPEKRTLTWAEVQEAYFAEMEVTPQGVERNGEWNTYKGTVTNNGKRTVTYWKLAAKFNMKKGDTFVVVDTGFVNSAERLGPGESKKWQLMHREDGSFPMYQWEELRLER